MSDSDDASVHLRAAALELIAAARAMLDLTEELVKDPGPVMSAVAALAAVARQAAAQSTATQSDQAAHRGSAEEQPGNGPDSDESGPRPRPKPRVQHIRVS